MFEKQRAFSVLREVLTGLEFIHAQRHVHLDLKSSNVLLTKGGAVKLSDFGTVQLFRDTLTLATRKAGMTEHYAAPERFDANIVPGPAADVWSAGMVLLEMLTGRIPYADVSAFRIVTAILKGPPEHKVKDAFCVRFWQQCWARDPQQRPSVSALLKMLSAEMQRVCGN